MKKVLLAGSALVAALSLATAAHAADVSVAPAYDWTGFYLGANAGIAWNNSEVNNDFDIDTLHGLENNVDGDQTAFTAGGIVGYNYQIDQIVLGVEADFNYLGFSQSGKRSVVLEHGDPDVTLTGKGSSEADWFGTIRGRLGFAADNFLIYGTGGLAYGHMNADGKVTAYVGDTKYDSWSGSSEQTNWGWTLGGGVEYGIDRWSVGVEYLYVDLGDGEWSDRSSDNAHDYRLKGDVDYAFSTVRASVKYRF